MSDKNKSEALTEFNTKNSITDSSRVKITKQKIKPDRVKFNVKKESTLKKDSANNKPAFLKKLKTAVPKGSLSLGYDYGFLPYTVDMPSPASAVKAEGLVETDLLGLPVDVSFFYSTQKNLIGVNNYFRISYNADRYKDKLNTKLGGNIDTYKNNLSDLNAKRQQHLQKMAYADYLSSISPDKWPTDSLAGKNGAKFSLAGLNLNGQNSDLNKFDTTRLINNFNKADTLRNNKYASKADSLRAQAIVYKNKKDSVTELYNGYKREYDQITDSIKKVQTAIEELEAMRGNNNSCRSSTGKIPYFNKAQNFLSGIKKLDIGLCYPEYSTFLTNNVPVRGINFEYQKNGRFFGFTYGTTVSTLLYNNKSIDGLLQGIRNSYNYFDINNLSAGRKILAAKFGFGEKEGDHFFIGFLVGKGANSYLPDGSVEIAYRQVESNLVVEADGSKKLGKNTVLDLVAGKSSVQQEDLSMGTLQTAAHEVFSNFRSYAALARLKTSLPATKSGLTFSFRWVDPFFTSFGIGFIRSDNVRYEVKLDQPLGKLFRYTVMFRREEDNLLKLLDYKNTFYSVNNIFTYKIKRGLMLRVGYTPLVRTLNGENYHVQNKNTIVTSMLTFSPKGRRVQKQFSLLYNYYLVNSDSASIHFQNFAYYHQFSFKSGFKTGLNISWFKNSVKDTANNNLFLAVLDAGYQFKNGSMLSVAGKSAYKINDGFYPGFIVKSTVKLSGTLFWENQIEKFIVGDLFNGYNQEILKQFPYCFTTKFILNF